VSAIAGTLPFENRIESHDLVGLAMTAAFIEYCL